MANVPYQDNLSPYLTFSSGVRLYSDDIIITDAQIKALPTTPVDIVAAPGAGKILVPIETVLMFKSSATAYTNISPSAYLFAQINGNQLSSFLGNDTVLDSVNQFSGLFGSTGGIMCRLLYPETDGFGLADGWGNMSLLFGTDANANQPLQLTISNAALGNMTGGNAGNKVLASTLYRVLILPT